MISINDELEKRHLTKYRLSIESGVPQATINNICSGKTDLEKCAAGTLYRIAKALDISVEAILESVHQEYRCFFENFKSNTCHQVKDLGDAGFILDLLETDRIRTLYDKRWYPEALYLLAMLDYVDVVKRKTRRFEQPVSEKSCGFKSHRPHEASIPCLGQTGDRLFCSFKTFVFWMGFTTAFK